MKHRDKHPENVEGCYACKLSGISFGADAMPTRQAEVADKNAREKELSKDLVSFKNMVKDGKKPPTLRGAHRYEQEAK